MADNITEFYTELRKELAESSPQKHKNNLNKLKFRLSKKYKIKKLPTDIEIYLNTGLKIETKPSRTLSGVSVVAIMTKPLKCPHGKCLYCPGGIDSFYGDVPQSYTGNEPATMRAIRNDYDPYLQVFNRLEQYVALGQNFNKIELIIMGGTFPSYELSYQDEFIMYAFKAMNDFSDMFFSKDEINLKKYKAFFELPGNIDDENRAKNLKQKILKLKQHKLKSLKYEQKRNEDSKVKCVALAIETRPDYAKEAHIKTMLNQGCTRVELGVQSVNDKILKFAKRGHNVKDIIESTRLMKDSFLKVGYHMMLGLDSVTNEKKMFAELFSNPVFRPDALKIYPALVIKGTGLYNLWLKKKYRPIKSDDAVKLISEIKNDIPEYVRIMRIERDIPEKEIVAPDLKTNLRQYIDRYMKEHGLKCECIRCREIKEQTIDIKKIKYNVYEYSASLGKEYFISADYLFEGKNYLVGFLRLRKPFKPFIGNLNDAVGIRELHVYGKSLSIGESGKKESQHRGIGKKLMQMAEKIAFTKLKAKKIAIISGVGARSYYKKLGYKYDGFYMSKNKSH